MIKVTNDEFITMIFGEDAPWCHVTDFTHDPMNIPKDRHLAAWKGDYYSRYNLTPGSNQYFTISTFYCDDQQQARRRRALYRQTHCIVLDDVKEKLSHEAAQRLPSPSWILETSPGSEQWGYILDTPCTERARAENLLDGLVSNGLAPEGKDPGMKGVTRYVRLPEGANNKASKLVDGQPYKCQMRVWEPFNRVSMEELAAPFAVDLDALRRDQRIDGAAAVSDHPLVNIPDIISIKEVRSDGRFDITCPWVEEHTGADDSGSAIFTNQDGSIGFRCHHGSCDHRNGGDLLRFIDGHSPGFSNVLKHWQVQRSFGDVMEAEVSFMGEPVAVETPMQNLCDALRRERPNSPEIRELAQSVLKLTDDLPKIEQKHWHDEVCDIMRWNKTDFKEILTDLRKQWYDSKVSSAEFYDDVMFVKEQNKFYNRELRMFFSVESFHNSYSHEDPEARKTALQDGRVKKVDRLDYAPRQPPVFVERGCVYGNTWTDSGQSEGAPGDASRWIEHFDALGWAEHRSHVEKWMAYTLRYPENKINHMLLMGSGEGCGKDFLLYPLVEAMGDNHSVISGEELLEGFNEYLLSTKYLHINEAELGDRREAMAVSNKLKPMAAAPPTQLSVNQKGVTRVKVRNIVNATMTTNSVMPLRLNGASRRFYAMWSDLNPLDEFDNMRKDWLDYWEDRWTWMKGGGWKHVVHHLMQVDLSTFNPNEAPPMTEFLRDIKELSKSPMQQTIELFIKKKHGAFRSDLMTATDMSDTLKGGMFLGAEADLLCDSKYFTPVKVGVTMKEMRSYPQIIHRDKRLWVVRDREKYLAMSSAEAVQAYERQIKDVKGDTRLTVVK